MQCQKTQTEYTKWIFQKKKTPVFRASPKWYEHALWRVSKRFVYDHKGGGCSYRNRSTVR